MSKKTPVKKSKRRLKRSVRRSLAAVLMITAIGVAAIPVPENFATEPGTGGTGGTETPAEKTAYDYPKYDDLYKLKLGVDLSRPENKDDIIRTYGTFPVDDKNNTGVDFRLEWQFECKSIGVRHIICGYNDLIEQEELTVYVTPPTAYIKVSETAFSNFQATELKNVEDDIKNKAEGANGTAKWFFLPGNPEGTYLLPDDLKELTTYFNDEYEQRKILWENYQDYLTKYYQPEYDALKKAAEDKAGATITATADLAKLKEDAIASLINKGIPQVEEPKDTYLSCKNFKKESQWQQFYCDRTKGLSGCTLEKVLNSADRSTSVTSDSAPMYTYLPRVIDEKKYGEDPYDRNGFMYSENMVDIAGIGNNVFAGVKNVNKVILPTGLRYIGDSAFEDSYITSIEMDNVMEVGNRAFYKCGKLSEVTLGDSVTKIGAEAFSYVSLLKKVDFPSSITYIGCGAFASCNTLSEINMSKVTSSSVEIDDYAFYDDTALSKIDWIRADEPGTYVNVVSIGNAAFAVKSTESAAAFKEFNFPSIIDSNKGDTAGSVGLGDYILAGRANLEYVTMPSNYGSSSKITIPNHIFYNCINMKELIFPAVGTSCGRVSYAKDLFASVITPGFLVRGPKYSNPSNRTPADPRKSTWVASTAVSNVVPYVYVEDGQEFYEVSDGDYLECIDNEGTLTSCSLNPDIGSMGYGTVDLIIPAEVAGQKVKKISPDCFKGDKDEPDDEKSKMSRKMCKVVRSLTLQDGSEIAEIGPSVFANWTEMSRVYIGDSVRTIGASAFQNCSKLIDVYFNTPEEKASEFNELGANAFQTNSSQLTFHGVISPSYKPFVWATDEERTIDTSNLGIRICYKGITSYLTVLRDNTDYTFADGKTEKLLTLVDYPKYDQIASLLGETYAVRNGLFIQNGKVCLVDSDKIVTKVTPAAYYKSFMESYYYNAYSSGDYDDERAAFKAEWDKAVHDGDEERKLALYKDFKLYGPWITENFCNNYVYTPPASEQSNNALKSITDWLFEPITAYAASDTSGTSPKAYFEKYPYDVYDFYEKKTFGDVYYGPYQTNTKQESELLLATTDITVPDGVKSIDVCAMYDNEKQANSGNAGRYLSPNNLGDNTYDMYHKADSNVTDHDKGIKRGLFSGDYDDEVVYERDTNGKPVRSETPKGNDRLKSINLNQVVYLPDYAFDNCENLQTVTIGEDCEKMGALPFRGCTSLTTLNIADGNERFVSDKRILYSRNKDNASYTLEECLETRGMNNDLKLVGVQDEYDTYLSQVSAIAPNAFEKCDFVTRVNLGDAKALTEVPESCFKNCKALTEVALPASVRKINKEVFYNTLLGKLKIPGKEVFISTDAFQHETNKQQPTYVNSNADTAVERYVATYGDISRYYLEFEKSNIWSVRFYDKDGSPISETDVESETGKPMYLTKDQIPDPPIHEGYTFNGWVGTNGVDPRENAISQDTDFIATYYSSSGMVGDGWIVNFYDGMTGDLLKTQTVPDGEAAEAPPVLAYYPGYKFLKYSADFSNVTSNLQIVALYTVDDAAGSGTTSGGTTNTSGGTTNNGGGNNGTSSSSSSTSTSGSSTSTTSATSAAPRHTVTVVNGYGSGSYAEGETVIIVANEPAAGQKFAQWRTESEGVELVMILASATTFVMPANNVLVTAEFTAGTAPASTTPAPTIGTVSTNPGNTRTTSNNNGNTRVDITKPGISNKNLATANVNGSTDNFIVKISETPEATQAVVNALANKYGNLDNILYYAMDISLYDSTGTTKITDTTGLSVDITMPLPDALVTYGGNNMMGAVVASNQLEDMSERFTTIGGVPCISFTATHFSPYTVYVNTQNLSEGLLDVTPKTGDPIHPKWFLSIGLAALSVLLFMKKDRKTTVKTA